MLNSDRITIRRINVEDIRVYRPGASIGGNVSTQVALIGAGRMGAALVDCWLSQGLAPEALVVVEPYPTDDLINLTNHSRVRLFNSLTEITASTVLFLAVKPQISDEVIPHLRRLIGNNTLIVSIMAGKSIARIEERIDRNVAIVRAMPNLPATVGRGITVAVGSNLSGEQWDLATALLAATGAVIWIEDEHLMDAITALSGSGPAYVFLLAESLARAGAAAGLPPKLAEILARETVAGSGELLYRSELSASELRRGVTSPGGTTEAALKVLTDTEGLDPLLQKAIAAATQRSRELAG